ncbi:MAG: hypothetical protein RXR18_05160 [Nitrososphaeria archaeon]
MYLIPKLLHNLRYLKNKSYLSSFWISIIKKYRMRRLGNILRAKGLNTRNEKGARLPKKEVIINPTLLETEEG